MSYIDLGCNVNGKPKIIIIYCKGKCKDDTLKKDMS